MNAPKCSNQKPNGPDLPTRNDGPSCRELNPVSARRIEAAAVHLLAARQADDIQRVKAALSAMLDEGMTIADVLVMCCDEVGHVEPTG